MDSQSSAGQAPESRSTPGETDQNCHPKIRIQAELPKDLQRIHELKRKSCLSEAYLQYHCELVIAGVWIVFQQVRLSQGPVFAAMQILPDCSSTRTSCTLSVAGAGTARTLGETNVSVSHPTCSHAHYFHAHCELRDFKTCKSPEMKHLNAILSGWLVFRGTSDNHGTGYASCFGPPYNPQVTPPWLQIHVLQHRIELSLKQREITLQHVVLLSVVMFFQRQRWQRHTRDGR